MHQFDKDYYENGVKKHISGYENYRWMPTRSFPEAIDIINAVYFASCIDYGCAKGYLVHALNLLNKSAQGVDISEYAIENCHPAVKNRVKLLDESLVKMGWRADLLVAKDVLEHIPEEQIPSVLYDFRMSCDQALFIIPLGDDDKFRIREYEMDLTHVTKKDEEWWISQAEKVNFRVRRFSYSMGYIKEKWLKVDPFGNGFFLFE